MRNSGDFHSDAVIATNPEKLVFKSLLIIGAPPVRNVATRPLSVAVNSSRALKNLGDTIHRAHDTRRPVSPDVVAKDIGEIVTLSDTPRQVGIVHGWDTPRLRYVLIVETQSQRGVKTSYIQGYTEFDDRTRTGKMDHSMRFYIDNIVETSSTTQHDGRMRTRMKNAMDVITDYGGDYANPRSKHTHHRELNKLIRPRDVVMSIHHQETGARDLVYDTRGEAHPMVEYAGSTGSMVTDEASTSVAPNNVSSVYLSKIVNAVAQEQSINDTIDGYSEAGDISGGAAITLAEPLYSDNPFIQKLEDATNDYNPTFFELRHLGDVFPGVDVDYDERIQVFEKHEIPFMDTGFNILDTEDTDRLDTVDRYATMATTIANEMTSHMVLSSLSVFSMLWSNMVNINEPYIASVTNVRSLILTGEDVDLGPNADACINLFESQTAPHLTRNDDLEIEVVMNINLYETTTVALTVEGEGPYVYRFPTFARGLLSSNVASDIDSQGYVNDMFSVVSTAKEEVKRY